MNFDRRKCWALLLWGFLGGAQAADEAVDVEVFHGVEIKKAPNSNAYPPSEERNGKEGWAVLNMMIDPQGKPYEVTVVDSIGSPAFEQAAIKALDQMSFEPAKRGTTPIDSSFTFKMYFSRYSLATGARAPFVAAYRKFVKAIQAGDQAAADEQLAKMDVANLYEEAFRSYSKYFYDAKWGTEAEQLRDLQRAVAGENSAHYLPKDAFTTALSGKFLLEVKANDFGRALHTWQTLERLAPKEIRAQYSQTVDALNQLRNSDKAVALSTRIDRGTTWHGYLFKNRFSVAVTNGAVAEIKLRCEKQYLFFKYDPALQYSVSSKSGPCGIEVVGTPGTTFDLIQS